MTAPLKKSKNITPESEPSVLSPAPVLWVIFRQPLQIFFIVGIIALLSFGGSYIYLFSKQKQKTAMDLEFTVLEKKHADLQEMRDLIDSQDYKIFFQLKDSGFYQSNVSSLGMAAWRITMEEPLLNLQTQVNLWVKPRHKGIPQFNFSYAQPELKSATPIKIEHQNYQLAVYQSQLNLEASLMHEGYLLDMLQYIKNAPLIGLLVLKQCQLDRLQEKIDPEIVNAPNLQFNCKFEWTIARTEAIS